MTDQRTKAGNIGDVLKHALLPEIVQGWLESVGPGKSSYVETHAGFCGYGPDQLRDEGGSWDGERAFTLAPLEDYLAGGGMLGAFGEVLGGLLPRGEYPGSMKIVAETGSEATLRLVGFDIGEDQIASYASSSGLDVRRGDGYAGCRREPGPKLVFCDPFWKDPTEVGRVADLEREVSPLVVWYPIIGHDDALGPSLGKLGGTLYEAVFREWGTRGWSSRDLRGSGMALFGLDELEGRLGEQMARLEGVYAGRIVEGRALDLSRTIRRI